MTKHTFTQKSNGDALNASEWNDLTGYIDEIVDNINNGSSGGSVVSTEVDPLDSDKTFVKIGEVTVAELTSKGTKGTNVGLSGNNNINIEPRPAAGTGEGKNTPGLADRKGGNIALKPGDDIELWAHKRGTSKNDEVSVKVMTEVPKASDPTKTDEVAAKLQLNTGDIVLTSKDKQEDSSEMNITVNKATNTRGYLKVRAQAIDLRCEDHGGIALQPKGRDGQGNMNKIKFEHGGGDGLEFGTFNTEHTSLFTGDYRFNKNGILRLATRTTQTSNKANSNDDTTSYKYVKQSDDLYDVIDQNDPVCTWEDIIKYIAWAKSNNQGYFSGQDFVVSNGLTELLQGHDSGLYELQTALPNGLDDFCTNLYKIKIREISGNSYTISDATLYKYNNQYNITIETPSSDNGNLVTKSIGKIMIVVRPNSSSQYYNFDLDSGYLFDSIEYKVQQ